MNAMAYQMSRAGLGLLLWLGVRVVCDFAAAGAWLAAGGGAGQSCAPGVGDCRVASLLAMTGGGGRLANYATRRSFAALWRSARGWPPVVGRGNLAPLGLEIAASLRSSQ